MDKEGIEPIVVWWGAKWTAARSWQKGERYGAVIAEVQDYKGDWIHREFLNDAWKYTSR